MDKFLIKNRYLSKKVPAKQKKLENRAKTSACRPSRGFSNLFRVSVMFAVYKCLQYIVVLFQAIGFKKYKI